MSGSYLPLFLCLVMKKAFLNWSSGKDAAYALYLLQQQKQYAVEKLVCTVNSEVDRVSMHGLRKDLLLQQAKNIGIPLHIIPLQGNVSMDTYNRIMKEEMQQLKQEGFTHSVFGDIFLEDLKAYREQQLQKVDLEAVFPLWKMDTKKLMQDFLKAGFKAITVSVNAAVLDSSFCGRSIDEEFLAGLPASVDPCGENGEFHTFVFDGPIFREPINFRKGEIVAQTYELSEEKEDNCFSEEQSWDNKFWYCDLLPQ
ncbi:MAG: diphthine--ammonia ligase [Salinimicrobium sp.]